MVPTWCLLPTSPSRFRGSPALLISPHPPRFLPACLSTPPDEQSPQVCRAVKGCVCLIDWKSSCGVCLLFLFFFSP